MNDPRPLPDAGALPAERILVTGSNGFIGHRLVANLLDRGYRNLCCFVRPSSNLEKLEAVLGQHDPSQVRIVRGTLLNRDDCARAAQGASVVYHLAAGTEKTFPGSYMNSVVTTRNLIEALLDEGSLKRFVNVSSFSVYSNKTIRRRGLLDESCPLEEEHMQRWEPYSYAKVKQDELVERYGEARGLPWVTLRPGAVYGESKPGLSGRIGLDTFGFFMHLGGGNRIPLTYVDNCADAMVEAGLRPGLEGQIFNVTDDDLPTSRRFLRRYKKARGRFFSLPVPYRLFYLFSAFWEGYARRSGHQLPPAFNRPRCRAYWKGNRYSNRKLKEHLGWSPPVATRQALDRYFQVLAEGRRQQEVS